MSNRSLFGHRNIVAHEFKDESFTGVIGEVAAWLHLGEHINDGRQKDIISFSVGYDGDTMCWICTLVWDSPDYA